MAMVLNAQSKSCIKMGMQRPTEDFIKKSTRRVEISTGKERMDRLDQHHEAMKLSLGGLYPCPDTVQAILAPVPGETKRIMDIGCGSRIWAIEMAKEFPHAEVLGLDVPQAVEHWKGEYPPNCRFEGTDFQFAMPERFIGRFDIIHLRFIASAFSQFQKSMEEIQACLRPGGLLILVDSTGEVLAQDGVTVLPMRSNAVPNGCQLQRLFYEIRHASTTLGLDEFAMRATLEDGLWCDWQLDDCGAAELLVPIGPWAQGTNPGQAGNLQRAGRLMQGSLENVQKSHHKMLQNLGFSASLSEQWQKITSEEVNDPNLKMLLDVRILWGRRREGEDLPAPALNMNLQTSASGTFTSPYLHVYKTHREWLQITENRQKIKGWRPDPVAFVYRVRKRPRRGSGSRTGAATWRINLSPV